MHLLINADSPLNRCVPSYSSYSRSVLSEESHVSTLQVLHLLENVNYLDRSYTYVCILQGCIHSKSLDEGRLIHNHLIETGWKLNIYISTALLNMYAQCGNIEDAKVAFDTMGERHLVTWNSIISAHCSHQRFEEALGYFWGMQNEGINPDDASFVSALRASAGLASLQQGEKVHSLLKSSALNSKTLIQNSLIQMYLKCESMENARKVFDKMEEKDVSSWNTIMSGYLKNGNVKEVMSMFEEMLSSHIEPDEVTYVIISNVCAILKNLEQANKLHVQIERSHITPTTLLWNSLIDMYAHCGRLTDAQNLFLKMPKRDNASWNALIGGFVNDGHCEEAFYLYTRMKLESFFPDHFSFVLTLSACATLEHLTSGKQMHLEILNSGYAVNVFVENALLDMYANFGSLSIAWNVLNQMSVRNVVSWNTVIMCHIKLGLHNDAFKVFQRMELEGVKPDQTTYVILLNACASLAALKHGLEVHYGIALSNLDQDVLVANALIDVYSKCGRLKDACKVFDRMPERDVVSWNIMIAGFGQHGIGYNAIKLADCMLKDGVSLNHVTFVGILTACSYAGLMDKGMMYFSCMTQLHGVEQATEHYGCVVDLLGRAGHLWVAVELLRRTALGRNASLWKVLLGACRIHSNLAIALCAAEHILDFDPNDTAALLVLSHILQSDRSKDDALFIAIKDAGNEEELFF